VGTEGVGELLFQATPLDQRLERQSSRETLLALPVHRARRPEALNKRPLRHVSREFVGFGMAPVSDIILNDEPHSVTLVFSDRLLAKQRLEVRERLNF
jgi:hypothetical protein